MYPANKTMDGLHSGTGVFYQAMPAVGADGKNIMKLIPVQMVNRQFYQSQINKPKTVPAPQKTVSINVAVAPVQTVKTASLNPSITQQVIRKVSLINGLPNQVGPDICSSLKKCPQQQKTVNLISKVPPVPTPAANCENPRFSSQLPVTVTSPALPRGQYLQIPPNAQVRTVPGSELPLVIKKQIFTTSANSSPGSGLPSVVYVSPINTVNQSVTSPSDSALQSLKLVSKTPNVTYSGHPSKGPQKHLKLVPKVAQRPNSPLKWMVEEEDNPVSPSLDPLNSPSMTSEILLAVAERENASRHCNVITKPTSQSSQSKSGQGQENALVMCNGKVYFVAKKCCQPLQMGGTKVSPARAKSHEIDKNVVPSFQRSLETAGSETITISDESDDVIDLCNDDDAQDGSAQQAAPVNTSAAVHPDEDNVIFVSYIPPKSVSRSAQNLQVKSQKANVQEIDQKGTCDTNSVTDQKSLDGTNGSEGREKPDQNSLVSIVKTLSGSTEVNMFDNEGTNSLQNSCSQQLENVDIHVDTESPSDHSRSSGICSLIEDNNNIKESSENPAMSFSLAPKSCPMADRLLRQIFNITADVKICLQRIDESLTLPVPAKSVDNHQEPVSGFKERLLPDLHRTQETDTDNLFTPTPHTRIGPLSSSHIKLKSNHLSTLKCSSGQKPLKGNPRAVESQPVIGFVEPIDEDFLSTDENDIPNSQDMDVGPQTLTCVDVNTNTRRMGRTRKRTMCPCCIPCTEIPAVKSNAKSLEPEKWSPTAEKMSKKGGRAKVVRKDEKTSGRLVCLTAKNRQKCKPLEVPATDNLSTRSMECDELTRLEKIERLKRLLREKEAALELMRNSMS